MINKNRRIQRLSRLFLAQGKLICQREKLFLEEGVWRSPLLQRAAALCRQAAPIAVF